MLSVYQRSYPICNDFSIYALAGITSCSYSLETKNQHTITDGNKATTKVTFKGTGTHSEVFLDYKILPDLAVSTLDSSSWKSASIGVNYFLVFINNYEAN
jgi:hypothetical protein